MTQLTSCAYFDMMPNVSAETYKLSLIGDSATLRSVSLCLSTNLVSDKHAFLMRMNVFTYEQFKIDEWMDLGSILKVLVQANKYERKESLVVQCKNTFHIGDYDYLSNSKTGATISTQNFLEYFQRFIESFRVSNKIIDKAGNDFMEKLEAFYAKAIENDHTTAFEDNKHINNNYIFRGHKLALLDSELVEWNKLNMFDQLQQVVHESRKCSRYAPTLQFRDLVTFMKNDVGAVYGFSISY